jgi:hypothetical protein
MDDVALEVEALKKRNIRVEADKAWEVSLFRKLVVLVVTYVVASVALYVIGVKDFYLGAFIPTLGFFLSTLTFPFIKEWWVQKYLKNKI